MRPLKEVQVRLITPNGGGRMTDRHIGQQAGRGRLTGCCADMYDVRKGPFG